MRLPRTLTVVLIFSLLLSANTCSNCGHFDDDGCNHAATANAGAKHDADAPVLAKFCPFKANVLEASKAQHPESHALDFVLDAELISFCCADFISLPFEFRCFNSIHPPPVLSRQILRC